jgi:hypothetical protein
MSRLKRKQSGTTTSAAIHISSHKQPTERTGEDSTDQRLRQITRYTSGFRASFQPVDISRSNDAIMIPISNLRSIPCLSFGARGNTRADAVRGRVALVRPATLSLISQLPKHTQVLLPLYSASYTRSSPMHKQGRKCKSRRGSPFPTTLSAPQELRRFVPMDRLQTPNPTFIKPSV